MKDKGTFITYMIHIRSGDTLVSYRCMDTCPYFFSSENTL